MAHHVRIKATPHTNKDGSLSKTKKDHVVTVRTRGKGKRVIGVETSRAKAEELRENYWEALNANRESMGVS